MSVNRSAQVKAKRVRIELFWIALITLALILCLFNREAAALPWDTDMYKQQSYKANEMARAPVKGTIPRGFKPFRLTNEEAAEQLTNPTAASIESVWRGQRIYNANCWTCHGKTGDGQGPIGIEGSMGVPNILDAFYKASPDGKVFGVIYNGGANMPRYGYKFSHEEIWDVVNYLRFLQGKVQAEGVKKP